MCVVLQQRIQQCGCRSGAHVQQQNKDREQKKKIVGASWFEYLGKSPGIFTHLMRKVRGSSTDEKEVRILSQLYHQNKSRTYPGTL